MRITLTYNGVIQIRPYQSGQTIDIPDHATPATVMTLCEIKPQHQPHVIPFINGNEARAHTPLKEGDQLSLFLPLGGG